MFHVRYSTSICFWFVKGCCSIEELSLRRCTDITDSGNTNALLAGNELRVLIMFHKKRITCSGSTLPLSNFSGVSISVLFVDLLFILTGHFIVKLCSLWECIQVTDKGIEAVAKSMNLLKNLVTTKKQNILCRLQRFIFIRS